MIDETTGEYRLIQAAAIEYDALQNVHCEIVPLTVAVDGTVTAGTKTIDTGGYDVGAVATADSHALVAACEGDDLIISCNRTNAGAGFGRVFRWDGSQYQKVQDSIVSQNGNSYLGSGVPMLRRGVYAVPSFAGPGFTQAEVEFFKRDGAGQYQAAGVLDDYGPQEALRDTDELTFILAFDNERMYVGFIVFGGTLFFGGLPGRVDSFELSAAAVLQIYDFDFDTANATFSDTVDNFSLEDVRTEDPLLGVVAAYESSITGESAALLYLADDQQMPNDGTFFLLEAPAQDAQATRHADKPTGDYDLPWFFPRTQNMPRAHENNQYDILLHGQVGRLSRHRLRARVPAPIPRATSYKKTCSYG